MAIKNTKSEIKAPIANENDRITPDEKEVIRQAVYKATTNGWVQGAFILMQFENMNIPFVFHSFFSDVNWAQHYFKDKWIEGQHEMLTICQINGVNAVIDYLKKNNSVIETKN